MSAIGGVRKNIVRIHREAIQTRNVLAKVSFVFFNLFFLNVTYLILFRTILSSWFYFISNLLVGIIETTVVVWYWLLENRQPFTIVAVRDKKEWPPWLFSYGFIVILYLIFWIRPYLLYGEVSGYGPVFYFAGKSSCSNSASTSVEGLVYNSLGTFSTGDPYVPAKAYAFCVLDQRWASATLSYIPGYERKADGIKLDCTREKKNGFLFNADGTDECGNIPFIDERAFGLDLFGASLGTVTNGTRDSGESYVKPCPTTSAELVTDKNINGVGDKICPVCLSYLMRKAGLSPLQIPAGYSHCSYLESDASNPFCGACPGGPIISNTDKFILADEVWKTDKLRDVLIAYSVLVFLKFGNLISFIIIIKYKKSLIRQVKPGLNKKK